MRCGWCFIICRIISGKRRRGTRNSWMRRRRWCRKRRRRFERESLRRSRDSSAGGARISQFVRRMKRRWQVNYEKSDKNRANEGRENTVLFVALSTQRVANGIASALQVYSFVRGLRREATATFVGKKI